MRKRWVFGAALVLGSVFAVMSLLYLEGDQFDRAVDGRTRTLAPGVTVTSHVLSSTLFTREVEATLKLHDRVFAQWEGRATLGFQVNMTLTPRAKSPMVARLRAWGIENYTDKVKVSANPFTKHVTIEMTTPALTIHHDTLEGSVGPGRLVMRKDAQQYTGEASLENVLLKVAEYQMGFAKASNQFSFVAPGFFHDLKVNWHVQNLMASKHRPVTVANLTVDQRTAGQVQWGKVPLYDQHFHWEAQTIVGENRGHFDEAEGDVHLQNVPLANLDMLKAIYEGIKTKDAPPAMQALFEEAGMAVVFENGVLRTADHESTWSGVLRYAPVKGGPAQWGFGKAHLDKSSVVGFGYLKARLAHWADKGWIRPVDDAYEVQGSWDEEGIKTPMRTLKWHW